MILASRLRKNGQIIIRVDAHSTLKALSNDETLKVEGIQLEIGSANNKNKNAVAVKAIRELREEIVRIAPSGGKILEWILAKALMTLNFRILHTGCSAKVEQKRPRLRTSIGI